MVYKIAVVGAHSCGKTTMCYNQAYQLKLEDKSVAIIMEQARLCPFDLNTSEAAEWMVYNQILQEKVAEKGHKYIICDRTPADALIYAAVNGVSLSESFVRMVNDHMASYSEIIHLAPSRPIVDDGFRDCNEEYRAKIAEGFRATFGEGVMYFKQGISAEEVSE